jgi:DNA-binding transcriptional LysR family regulator
MTRGLRYLDAEGELDLRKVRYFLAVADLLSFSQAAEKLYIAQPALSRAVRALEADLGVTLLERDHHTVTLTEAGQVLVREGNALLARSAAARRRVASTVTSGVTLRVGFRPGIIITGVVQAFSREHPDVAVVAQRIEWDDQDAAVLDGRIDVGWVRMPIADTGLDLVPLHADPEMLALPLGHALAGRSSVTIPDLADESVLRYTAAPEHGIGRPAGAAGLRTMEEKLEAVALGRGLALVPATAAAYYQRPDIVYLPVTGAPPYQVALATAAGQSGRPEVAEFLRIAAAAYHHDRDTAPA